MWWRFALKVNIGYSTEISILIWKQNHEKPWERERKQNHERERERDLGGEG